MKIKLHPNAVRGFELFNAHEFFDAHEELEIAWRAEKSEVREMYRGILQVGVAYYHIQKGNFIGAKKMFERAFRWLEPYPDTLLGVNLKKFRSDAAVAYSELVRLGEKNFHDFNPLLFKPVEYKTQTSEGSDA